MNNILQHELQHGVHALSVTVSLFTGLSLVVAAVVVVVVVVVVAVVVVVVAAAAAVVIIAHVLFVIFVYMFYQHELDLK